MYGMMIAERASRSWGLMYQKSSALCGLSGIRFGEVRGEGLVVGLCRKTELEGVVLRMSDDILSASFVDMGISARVPAL